MLTTTGMPRRACRRWSKASRAAARAAGSPGRGSRRAAAAPPRSAASPARGRCGCRGCPPPSSRSRRRAGCRQDSAGEGCRTDRLVKWLEITIWAYGSWVKSALIPIGPSSSWTQGEPGAESRISGVPRDQANCASPSFPVGEERRIREPQMAEDTKAAAKAAKAPTSADIERAREFAREPFLLDGEEPEDARARAPRAAGRSTPRSPSSTRAARPRRSSGAATSRCCSASSGCSPRSRRTCATAPSSTPTRSTRSPGTLTALIAEQQDAPQRRAPGPATATAAPPTPRRRGRRRRERREADDDATEEAARGRGPRTRSAADEEEPQDWDEPRPTRRSSRRRPRTRAPTAASGSSTRPAPARPSPRSASSRPPAPAAS